MTADDAAVRRLTVSEADSEIRLDRWFSRHFPELPHVRLQKLLRTGQVRLDGRRAKPGDRVRAGQEIRVPPLNLSATPTRKSPSPRLPSEREIAAIRERVIYRDADVIAIDKPPGLAVQGGTGTTRHLDGMLDGLRFDARERPRLVHRLDRDTSGVLLLARSASAAARLGESFRGRNARKVYWAVTVGVPKPSMGRIDLPLGKSGGRGSERVRPDETDGLAAITDYRVLEAAANKLALVALWPRTGRTHQLRAHLAAIGCPILGDGKYGGPAAFVTGLELPRMLHLHARSIRLPHPSGRGEVSALAALPDHMRETFAMFGFDASRSDDPFAELD